MSALTTIPTTAVPFRYAAQWETSSTGLDFEADRTAAMSWLIERAYALDSIQSRTAAQNLAETLLREAEAEGSATVHADNEGGMGWVTIEAYQHPVTQGEADALAAHLASVLPVGTPVTAGDAMNRNVQYVGHVTAHTAESLVVAWVGGSTTEGKPLDMARILDVTDAPALARAQRDQDEAEAARITAAARQAVERADAERAARDADTAAYLAERTAEIEAAPLVLDMTPRRVHAIDTHRTGDAATDLFRTHRFAFRTTSVEGTYLVDDEARAVVDPGWTAHEAADTALRYVVEVLRVTEAVALAAMLSATAATDPWETAAPITDTRGVVAVWCSAVRTAE